MFRRAILLLGCSLAITPRAESGEIVRPQTEVTWGLRQVATSTDVFYKKDLLHKRRATRTTSVSDISDCVLLLGSFCNGELRAASEWQWQ